MRIAAAARDALATRSHELSEAELRVLRDLPVLAPRGLVTPRR
jgi:hypothetical protein